MTHQEKATVDALLHRLWLEGGGNPALKVGEVTEQNVADLLYGLNKLADEAEAEPRSTSSAGGAFKAGMFCIHKDTNSSVKIVSATGQRIKFTGREVDGDVRADIAHTVLTLVRPCPFCGWTEVDPEEWMDQDECKGPACPNCGAQAESVDAWNTRVPHAVASELLLILRSRLGSTGGEER